MNSHQITYQLRSLIPSLLIFIIFIFSGFDKNLSAQGWTFTATLTYAGPCGSYTPYIQPITFPPSIPTQSDCESLRQLIMSYEVSTPIYNDDNQYIGMCRVFYTCTPCSGSDIVANFELDYNAPGYVSIDGLMQGNAFFSPHQSQEIENWINNYLQRMQSLGNPVNMENLLPIQDFPLTGDNEFDQFYFNQLNELETTLPVNEPNNSNTAANVNTSEPDITGSTVQLLTTSEQISQRDEWWNNMGFNETQQVGTNQYIDESGTIPAGTSVGEAALLTALGQAPGLPGIIGDFMLNTTNETISGIQGVVNNLASGNDNQALESANNLPGQVVINATSTTAVNAITGQVTGFITKPVLGLVHGAETVYGYTSTALDFWNNLTGKK
ncbi:MAG: hypothetical protein H6542_04270 [Lentimicrobiaceae bacterium]|nr:hypothetical protein [Lentimicrobiaceae bacterium]